MANDKIIAQKQAIVAELKDKLQNAVTGVLVDYSGINVADDTALRRKLREAGVEYGVVKNTLTRFAAKEVGLEELSDVLNGTTALAVSNDDVVAPAKVLYDFSKEHDYFTIKGGFVEGKVVSVAELEKLEPETEEISQALAVICRQNNLTMEQLKEVYDAEFEVAVMKSVLTSKVMRLIRDAADITVI